MNRLAAGVALSMKADHGASPAAGAGALKALVD